MLKRSWLLHPFTLWILLFISGLALRYWYSSSEICFYTDQSRDAIVATQILNGDWKLFGPVVNGRGAVFHGVLYYYFIAPLYALGGGNPFFVSMALSLLSTLGLIPTFFLAKRLLKSQPLSLIVVGMVSVSLSTIETSASFWNLQLSIMLLPAYCLFLLRLYDQTSVLNGIVVGALLGLLVQSGFSNLQWLLPYGVVFGMLLFRHRNRRKIWMSALASAVGLGGVTSSMLLAEVVAWKRGLFGMQDSMHWAHNTGFTIQNGVAVVTWYFKSLTSFLLPHLSLATGMVIFVTVVTIFKTRKNWQWRWLGLLLLPPILSQVLTNSAASYLLTGYESLVYIAVVFVFAQVFALYGKHLSRLVHTLVVSALLAVFALSNIAKLQQDKQTDATLACVWKTGNLEEIQAIDYTYARAQGQPFSIDVVTEPYGINLKYGYLYAWYGQKTYGYLPVFSGGTQVGLPSEQFLKETQHYFPNHFILYEPGSYNYWFHRRVAGTPLTTESQNFFYYRQPPLETLQETVQFGKTITVDYFLVKE